MVNLAPEQDVDLLNPWKGLEAGDQLRILAESAGPLHAFQTGIVSESSHVYMALEPSETVVNATCIRWNWWETAPLWVVGCIAAVLLVSQLLHGTIAGALIFLPPILLAIFVSLLLGATTRIEREHAGSARERWAVDGR